MKMTVGNFKPILPGVRGKELNKVEEYRDDHGQKTEREEAAPPVSPESKRQKVESINSASAQSGPPLLPNLSEECDVAQQDKTAVDDKVIDLTNSSEVDNQAKSLSDQNQQSEEMSVAKVLTSMNGHNSQSKAEFAVSNI